MHPQVRTRPPLAPAASGAAPHRISPLAGPLPGFAQAVAEVLALQRDPWQLRPRMTKPAHSALIESVGTFRSSLRRRVASLHLCIPAPRVAEACAVVRCGRRCRALALRVEYAGGQWLCSTLRPG